MTIEPIRHHTIQPATILVITIPDTTTPEQLKRVTKALRKVFKGHKALVLGNAQLHLIHPPTTQPSTTTPTLTQP